jgi:hypothetical protein
MSAKNALGAHSTIKKEKKKKHTIKKKIHLGPGYTGTCLQSQLHKEGEVGGRPWSEASPREKQTQFEGWGVVQMVNLLASRP